MRPKPSRIATTHVGSLCRPTSLTTALRAKALGEPYDELRFEEALREAVVEVVARQVDVGIDIPSDGEFGKANWITYVLECFDGLETIAPEGDAGSGVPVSMDKLMFPEFYKIYDQIASNVWIPESELLEHASDPGWVTRGKIICSGRLPQWTDVVLSRDIANFQLALARSGRQTGFLPLPRRQVSRAGSRIATTTMTKPSFSRSRTNCTRNIAPSSSQGSCFRSRNTSGGLPISWDRRTS